MVALKQLIDLTGRTAIVTGGTGWLGARMCQALLEQGATVHAVSRGSSSDFASELGLDGCSAFHRAIADLSTQGGCDSVLAQVPGCSILINNHFSWPKTPALEDMSWDDVGMTLHAGVASPLYLTARLVRRMKDEHLTGSVVMVSSMYGHVAPDLRIYHDTPGMGSAVHYGAAKAALLQATRYFAGWGGRHGIRCNSISPGPFPRPGALDGKDWFRDELEKKTMLGRVGAPDELKGAVAFLASDLSSYVTGTDITVDGGWRGW